MELIQQRRTLKRAAVMTGLLLATYSLSCASATLVNRSPFVPAGFDPGAESLVSSPVNSSVSGYEFRGVYQIGDRYWFLVSEPKSRDGNWIELGQPDEQILARSYDPDTRSLTLVSNNTELKLELAQVDADPTPIPVKGLVKTTTRTPTKAPTPVRRTIRPTTTATADNQNTRRESTPPPAWLEKLRSEAAERRARGQGSQNATGNEQGRRSITPNRPNQRGQASGSPQNKSKPPSQTTRSR